MITLIENYYYLNFMGLLFVYIVVLVRHAITPHQGGSGGTILPVPPSNTKYSTAPPTRQVKNNKNIPIVTPPYH